MTTERPSGRRAQTRPAGARVALVLSVLFAPLLTFRPGPAEAASCTLDDVPAATVLVPYFEVDLANADGPDTIVRLHNAWPEATVAHVTFWTDYSVPTVTFDVFLTGYDIVEIDLRDVFAGNLPITADEQSDPGDSISPHGSNPEWDGSFDATVGDCADFFPFYSNPMLQGAVLDRLVDGHTGQPVTVGEDELCLGSDIGEQIARGYLTIDDAVRCSTEFPSDPGYFGGAAPTASDDNQLWAEVWYLDEGAGMLMSAPAVALEAFSQEGYAQQGGTFYGRYGTDGADHRERLPTVWGASNRDLVASEPEWIVWRDGGGGAVDGYACEGEGWTPLSMLAASCFDDYESLSLVCSDDPTCLPLETQRVAAGDVSPWGQGWCSFDLSAVSIPGPMQSQAWVGVVRGPELAFAGGDLLAAVPLEPGCGLLGPDLIFFDDFETTDLSAWSSIQGGTP